MKPGMRKPGFGETSLGALMGAVVGSIGGLFAVGIVPTILVQGYYVAVPHADSRADLLADFNYRGLVYRRSDRSQDGYAFQKSAGRNRRRMHRRPYSNHRDHRVELVYDSHVIERITHHIPITSSRLHFLPNSLILFSAFANCSGLSSFFTTSHKSCLFLSPCVSANVNHT